MRSRVWLALAHHPTVDREGNVVTCAVTSLDLHDLARLARTFGLGGVYVITPLAGQQALVRRLLDHWGQGHGGQQNPCRREALEGVRVVDNLAEASRELEELWGTPPALVATSARGGTSRVPFDEARTRLGSAAEPTILVFGTGWGLAPEALESCHWVLDAVRGADDYNHLSVRSAASIVVDRLFGER